ncbi:hypothetical protein FHT36_004654 [Xanthobacter sp. SG618]|uniref:hypothetical protein n=1 Tax=Xanthobacter sp. SG618 TaxID=2587121 RepID=UPI00145D5069|nr:hypothetical protein [Xanthobacter sp. SG618]NMN60723.1 hypothetical protein [Xanthobacter sp. SG618]
MRMSQARKFFFRCTDEAAGRMTELFDFVWPTVSALVFARSKSYKYKDMSPSERRLALTKAFQSPRNLRPEYRDIAGLKRASLEKAFITSDWSNQEQIVARIVLINIFAIYEGWLDDLMDEIYPNPRTKSQDNIRKKMIDSCQFYDTSNGKKNWTWMMRQLGAANSLVMAVCFGKSLREKRYYSGENALKLLVCYRYFKELRNSIIHRNGRVNQYLETAASNYEKMMGPDPLGTKMDPPIGVGRPLVLGQEVTLSLFGVVGFNDIVVRLMTTLDAEVGLTIAGEDAIVRFLKSRINRRSVSGDRNVTARRMANEYGLVGLQDPAAFIQMLNGRGVRLP